MLRERIVDCKLVDSSDDYLNKWLIARNYDIDQAEKMLRHSLEWRRANKVDEILNNYTPPKVMTEYHSLGFVGKDKFGCPLWVTAQGRMDLIGILRSVTKKDNHRFIIWTVERMAELLKIHQAKRQSFIFDMEGLSMRQIAYKPAIDAAVEGFQMFESNYPENLRRVFIINAPRVFTIAYNLVKPFLHKNTIDKVRIFGFNKDEWLKAVLEEIDADQLPAFYGGTMTDPDGDPKCPSKFNMGGEIPREYYLSNSAPVPKDDMESLSLIPGAGGKKKLKFKVDAVNSILRWEFMSEGGDIGFRVYHKNVEEGSVDVVPYSRVESHLVMEEGQVVCDHVGKYVMEFDNAFSYLRPKKVRYIVVIEPPASKAK